MNLEALLAEVSAERPCGENLEYDGAFLELERAARGKEEHSVGDSVVAAEEPDWKDVANRAAELLERTKDLRVGVHLTKALLHSDGVIGLASGLNLLQGMLERYWETVHPQLDPADDNEPTFRINTISALAHNGIFPNEIRKTPFIVSKTFGPVSLRDIAIAKGEMAAPANSGSEPLSADQINAAFMECDAQMLQAVQRASAEAIDHATAIEELATVHVGVGNGPNLDGLRTVLRAINDVVATKADERGLEVEGEFSTSNAAEDRNAPAIATEPTKTPKMGTGAGQIRSREDVIRVLDSVCEYYERYEPSSPIPLLLRRARGLVAKDFMEILRDLVPDGIAQAETIRGSTARDNGGTDG